MSLLIKAFTGFFSIGAISLTSFVATNQNRALNLLSDAPSRDRLERNNLLGQTKLGGGQQNTLVSSQLRKYSEGAPIQGRSASQNASKEDLKESKKQDNVLFIDLLFDRFNESQGDSPIYYFWESENSKDQSNKSYVDLYKWDNKTKIFTLAKEKQELTIWKWWGEEKVVDSKWDLQYFYKFQGDNFENKHLKDYFDSHYETDKTNSIDKDKAKEAVYAGQWRVIKLDKRMASAIPAIKQSYNLISNNKLEEINLVQPIYWSRELQSFSEVPLAGQQKWEGVVELKNYKQYLDFLGLKWDSSRNMAVSAIEENFTTVASPELKSTKYKDSILFMTSILDKLEEYKENNPIYYFYCWEERHSEEWRGRKRMKSYVDLYRWDNKLKIFVVDKSKQELTIWKFWGKRGYDMQYFYRFLDDNFLNDKLKKYYDSGNKTDESPSLMGGLGKTQQDKEKHKQFVYVGQWKLIELGEESSNIIPVIKTLPKGITEEGLTGIKLERPIYWSQKLKSFVSTSVDEEQGDTIEIKHYKDYLDFLGLKWDKDQEKAVSQVSVTKKS